MEFVNEVRAVITEKKAQPMPLRVVAAEQHWWNIELPELKQIALHLDIALEAKASLLEALLTATMSVLECSEDRAVDIWKPRLKKSTNKDIAAVEELAA